MKENIESQKSRTIYYDYLRVFATIAVMMLHVAASKWNAVDVNGFDWKVFNFYDSIVRWGVPVFVMISGALFLGREDIPIKRIYTKYVLRMFIAYCVWSFIFYLFAGENIISQIMGLVAPGKLDSWISIINSHYHLWFVPMIAGLYVCLPIIKQIVKDEKISKYFLILSFVFWFLLPQIFSLMNDFGNERIIKIAGSLSRAVNEIRMTFVMNYVFYFILGYELSKARLEKNKRLIIYLMGLVGFLFTIIVDWILAIKTQSPVGNYYDSTRVNILLEAVSVFVLFENISFKAGKLNGFVALLSKWSFGAYLVHVLFIEKFRAHGLTTLSFSSIIAVPVIVVIVFICSFIVSGVIHGIPILKKYIV